jgi:hypothetical protein
MGELLRLLRKTGGAASRPPPTRVTRKGCFLKAHLQPEEPLSDIHAELARLRLQNADLLRDLGRVSCCVHCVPLKRGGEEYAALVARTPAPPLYAPLCNELGATPRTREETWATTVHRYGLTWQDEELLLKFSASGDLQALGRIMADMGETDRRIQAWRQSTSQVDLKSFRPEYEYLWVHEPLRLLLETMTSTVLPPAAE